VVIVWNFILIIIDNFFIITYIIKYYRNIKSNSNLLKTIKLINNMLKTNLGSDITLYKSF